MSQRKAYGIPAFLAAGLLLLIEWLRLSGRISEGQLGNYEILCNAVMLLIAAVGFFIFAQGTMEKPHRPVSCIAGNLAVPLIAFPMNIDVFGHVIRRDHIGADLWGWHVLWIACAVLQLLILSPLGKKLLTQCTGFLKWGKVIIVTLGNAFSDTAVFIKGSNKKLFLTILAGFILWVLYLVKQVSDGGLSAIFTDMQFWLHSLLFWILYSLTALLIHLFPAVLCKAGIALLEMKPQNVLAVTAAAAVCAASFITGPLLLKAASGVFILLCLLTAIIKRALERDHGERPSPPPSGQPGGEEPNAAIRTKDLAVLFLVFAVIPLAVIFVLALPSPAGRNLFPEHISDLDAWLDFGKEAQNIAVSFLSAF